MKHLSTISKEFSKLAAVSDWWDNLTYQEQYEYSRKHPRSKLRPSSRLPSNLILKVQNRQRLQGGLSDNLVKSEAYKQYIDAGVPGGYYGSRQRTKKMDKYVEERLRSYGLGSESIATWLSSTAARHMADDKLTSERVDDYTKDAFVDILTWSHPDHKGNYASTEALIENIYKHFLNPDVQKKMKESLERIEKAKHLRNKSL